MSTFVRMDWAVFGLCTRNVKFPIGPQGDLRVFSQVPHAKMGSSTHSSHSPVSAYSMNPLYWLCTNRHCGTAKKSHYIGPFAIKG